MPIDLEYQEVLELDLARPQYLPQVEEAVAYIYDHQLVREAWYFRRAITAALQSPQLPVELGRSYQEMLTVLSWLALPLLSESEVQVLLRDKTLQALHVGIDIERAILRKIWQAPPDVFPALAQQYLMTLRANTELLGAEPIEVRGETGLQPPTLGKYLTDYHNTLGDRKVNPFDVLQYLNQDPDIVRLSPQDKEFLKRAFRFYEGLKPLSLTEIREKMAPQERELTQLGTMPAPTPEEREMLGLPMTPAVPPVVRIPEQSRPPVPVQSPPLDLRKAKELRVPTPPSLQPIAAPPPAPAPLQWGATRPTSGRPATPAPPQERPVETPPEPPPAPLIAEPAPSASGRTSGEARLPSGQGSPWTAPAVSAPSNVPAPIPVPEPTASPSVFRPIRSHARTVQPTDVEPTLEGDVVDLKGK